MKMKFLKTSLSIELMVSASYAFSCSFNTDCDVGSKCVKNGGLYGYCMGGINPSNYNDRQSAIDLRGGGRLYLLI